MAKRTLVTSALPYANGPLHLGHLAGAYLPADIYTRFLRRIGEEVIHICGTDEHGAAITLAAQKQGISPKALVDHYHDVIRKDFEDFHIAFTHFSRTSRPIHHEMSQNFFLRLYEKGDVAKQPVIQFFCPSDQVFLPDRYVEGTCPYCGAQARGDQCESCGRWLEPFQLVEPRCTLCGNPPEPRETFHYYFRLSRYGEALRKWLEEKTHWKPHVRNNALSWVREGLQDRPITRDLSWGVPVPLEEAKGKVLYVWFDAPIGYISATREWNPEGWEDWWKDPETRLVHFIGKDNIIFHAIVWPAMLMAHGEFILPADIPANQFLVFRGGEKFSTSRGTAIWLRDALTAYPADGWRYVLTALMPEAKDSEFDLEIFRERMNNELADTFGNFIQRTLSFIHRHLGGRVEAVEWGAEEVAVLGRLRDLRDEIREAYGTFRFRDALYGVMEVARLGNRYLDQKEPWRHRKTEPRKAHQALYTSLQILRALIAWAEPVLPATAARVASWLSMDIPDFDAAAIPDPSLAGRTIPEPEVLFPKLEGPVVLSAPLRKKERKPEIDPEDFARLEIRVGRILSAEPHPDGDRLLVLKVSVGDEVRTVVAGIRDAYAPEDLVGRQVPVLVNLKPRKIRGVVSQGMILAATDPEGRGVLLMPDREVPEGSEVR